MSLLKNDKSSGGLKFPDFKSYHYAFSLKQSSLWLYLDQQVHPPIWLAMERELISPFSFQESLAFTTNLSIFRPSVLSHTRTILTPLLPFSFPSSSSLAEQLIWHNKLLRNHQRYFYWKAWWSRGLLWISQLLYNDVPLSFSELQAKFLLPSSCRAQYDLLLPSLTQYLVSLHPTPVLPSRCSSLFPLLTSTTSASSFYKCLMSHSERKTKTELAWETDLMQSWPTSLWDKLWTKLHKTSRAANTSQSLYLSVPFIHS